MLKRVIREKTAGPYVGMAGSTLAKLRRRGQGPPFYRTSTRLIVYDLSELDQWLETRRIEPKTYENVAKS
jgi:predicted DNA-binding transcriptional regulator AlpA